MAIVASASVPIYPSYVTDSVQLSWTQSPAPSPLAVNSVSGGTYWSAAISTGGALAVWGGISARVPSSPITGTLSQVVINGYNGLVLKSDGTVTSWGAQSYNGVWDVPVGLSGVAQLAIGEDYVLARKTNGTVVGWGTNSSGQLSIPVGLSGVTSIAAGNGFGLALKSDGTVVAWGSGYGCNVPVGLTGVAQIAAYYASDFALARKTDGTVVAWGVGWGAAPNTTIVPAGLSGVTSIAVSGASTSVALKSDGTMVSWGYDYFANQMPVGLTGITQIYGGYQHFLAKKADGTLIGWHTGNGPLAAATPLNTKYHIYKDSTPIAANNYYAVLQPNQEEGLWQVLAPNTASNLTIKAIHPTTGAITDTSNTMVYVTYPLAPTPLVISEITTTGCKLNWTAPSGTQALTYAISQGGNPAYSNLTGTEQVISGLAPGTSYTFVVTASNSAGTSTGASQTITTALPIPVAPSNLLAFNLTYDSFDISWDSVAYATSGYKVYLNNDWVANVNATTYSISNKTPGTEYTIEVSAFNGSGESPRSAPYLVTTVSASMAQYMVGDLTGNVFVHNPLVSAYSYVNANTLGTLMSGGFSINGIPVHQALIEGVDSPVSLVPNVMMGTMQGNIIQHLSIQGMTFTGLSIFAMPVKTTYLTGETFDPTGLVILANYNGGSDLVPNSALVFTGFDSSVPVENQVITVTLPENGEQPELSITFEINIQHALLYVMPDFFSYSFAHVVEETITVECNGAWSAVASEPWITIVNGTSGNGNGTITFNVAENPYAVIRNSTISITCATITEVCSIEQAGAIATLTIVPTSVDFAYSAFFARAIAVTTNTQWTATTEDGWLVITGGSGLGNGNVVYNVAANPDITSRGGTISISGGGITLTCLVNQADAPPNLSIFPESHTPDGSGGENYYFDVSSNIDWVVTANDSWIHITFNPTGSGSEVSQYGVDANSNTIARVGTLTVSGGGLTVTHTVYQAAAAASLVLAPELSMPDSSLHTGEIITVTCNTSWAASTESSWITITNGSGSGNGTITYNVAANPDMTARNGSIVVAAGGVTMVSYINQSAAAANLTLSSLSSSPANTAQIGLSVGVITNTNWSASTLDGWITITDGSGSGNGNVVYNIDANPNTSIRTGTITVTGGGITVIHTINQVAAGISITIDPMLSEPGNGAQSGQINVTSNSSWSSSTVASWITITSGSGTNNGTVTYNITTNAYAFTRTGTINVTAGTTTRTCTITQAASAPYLTVTPNLVSNPGIAASNQIITVTTNTAWTASLPPAVTWTSISSGASGIGDGQIVYNVQSGSTAWRSCAISTVGGGITGWTTIQQEAAPILTLTPSYPQSPYTNVAQTSENFTVTSNKLWTATADVSWITFTETNTNTVSHNGNWSFMFNIEANALTSPRTGTVTVSCIGITRTLTINQSAGYYITITPAYSSVGNYAQNIAFDIATNSPTWIVTGLSEGLTQTQKLNNLLMLDISANTSPTSIRDMYVNVATGTANGSVSAVASISQAVATHQVAASPNIVIKNKYASTYTMTVYTNVPIWYSPWTATSTVDWITIHDLVREESVASGLVARGYFYYDLAYNGTGATRKSNIRLAAGNAIYDVQIWQDPT